VPVVVSVLPEDEPIEELLPDVLGDDEVDELVSLLLEPLADGELEPLDEPVPEAPMLELELGEVLLEVLGDVLLELVDGEAPIVDEDDDEGEAPVVLLPEVLGEALVDGEVVDAPVELVPEPDMSPPDFGAVEVLLLLAPVLPAPPPEVPPAAPPPVWATA
jgi:hypothetical protein